MNRVNSRSDHGHNDSTVNITIDTIILITFRVSRRRREMYIGRARLHVCLSVFLSAAACPHYCADPDATWGIIGVIPSCAPLGGFAIGAHDNIAANAKCQRVLALCLVIIIVLHHGTDLVIQVVWRL